MTPNRSFDTSQLTHWRPVSNDGWVIGEDEAGTFDYLYMVRGAALTSENEVVVANGGDNTLRLYKNDGAVRLSAGGVGQGPGEFEMLWSLYPYRHDSLAAFDLSLRRVSIYDDQLTFVRSFQLPDIGLRAAVYLVGSDDAGTSYFFEDMTDLETRSADARDGMLYHTKGTLWALRDGAENSPVEIGQFTGSQVWLLARGGGIGMEVPVFGLVAVIGVTPNFLVTMDSAGHRLDLRDLSGSPIASVQSVQAGRPVTNREREWFIDQQLARVTSEQRRGALLDIYRTMPSPATLPEFGRAVRRHSLPSVVAADGVVFVRGYDNVDDDQTIWFGVEDTGEMWGVLVLPDNFDLLSVRSPQVAGVSRDSDGTETLRVFRIAPG
jgi:hypothetical protein